MEDKEFSGLVTGKRALVIHQKDNVAIALTDLTAGDECEVSEECGTKYQVIVKEEIPFGHKFALGDMSEQQPIYKYGEEIGKLKRAVKKGDWIHSHNMYCDRGTK